MKEKTTTWTAFNVFQNVRFKLTPFGQAAYENYQSVMWTFHNRPRVALTVDGDGYTRVTLQQFYSIFTTHLQVSKATAEPLFEDVQIEMEGHDLGLEEYNDLFRKHQNLELFLRNCGEYNQDLQRQVKSANFAIRSVENEQQMYWGFWNSIRQRVRNPFAVGVHVRWKFDRRACHYTFWETVRSARQHGDRRSLLYMFCEYYSFCRYGYEHTEYGILRTFWLTRHLKFIFGEDPELASELERWRQVFRINEDRLMQERRNNADT